MIRRAIALLAPTIQDRVVDLFCGLGNFTLPIAVKGAQVHGIEGSEGLIAMARDNANANRLEERCSFSVGNLFAPGVFEQAIDRFGHFNKVLIDPPREGAIEVVKFLAAVARPERIVYVSCDPGTLARDAAVLVNAGDYRLKCAGIINMFPQTSHVESMAMFERH